MYSNEEIIAKAWLVVDTVNLVLSLDSVSVQKIFLVGSYASNKQTEWSDLDFVVQLRDDLKTIHTIKRSVIFPTWEKIALINKRIDNKRIHVIFGTETSCKSLHQKHKYEKKDYSYRELNLAGLGELHAVAHTTIA